MFTSTTRVRPPTPTTEHTPLDEPHPEAPGTRSPHVTSTPKGGSFVPPEAKFWVRPKTEVSIRDTLKPFSVLPQQKGRRRCFPPLIENRVSNNMIGVLLSGHSGHLFVLPYRASRPVGVETPVGTPTCRIPSHTVGTRGRYAPLDDYP